MRSIKMPIAKAPKDVTDITEAIFIDNSGSVCYKSCHGISVIHFLASYAF